MNELELILLLGVMFWGPILFFVFRKNKKVIQKRETTMRRIEELKELGQLKKDGIITKEEFNQKKKELLSQNSPSTESVSKTPGKRGLFARTLESTFNSRMEKVSKEAEKVQKGYSEVHELKRLRNSGVLTKKEYETQLEQLKKNSNPITPAYIDFHKADDKLTKTLNKQAKAHAAHDRKFGSNEEQREEQRKRELEAQRTRLKERSIRLKKLKSSIIKLLKKQGTKIPASDIDAHLKYKNVDEVKKTCEKMYHDGRIGRTGNYRYFVLTKK